MSRAKVTDADLIDFLIATPKQATATEAARTGPASDDPAAHDAYTRLRHRLEPDAGALWAEVEHDVRREAGVLVIDDSVLDKPYARKMALVHRQYSGKHHRVVQGIGLVTLLWTDGDRHLPCDYRVYDKAVDGKTKNDHFGEMLATAATRGFQPECVLFDTWYSGLANLKRCRGHGWRWLTRFRSNRRVNPDRAGPRAVSECEIAATGTVVHLAGYGLVKVFRDRGHRRHGGALGHGRPGHGRPDPAAVGRGELADRGVPPGHQAGDQRRAVPVPGGPGPAGPHRPGPAGVRRGRAVVLADGRELVGGQAADPARRHPGVPHESISSPVRDCVSPIDYRKTTALRAADISNFID